MSLGTPTSRFEIHHGGAGTATPKRLQKFRSRKPESANCQHSLKTQLLSVTFFYPPVFVIISYHIISHHIVWV